MYMIIHCQVQCTCTCIQLLLFYYKTSAYFIFCERSLLVLEFGSKLVHEGDHILGLLNAHTHTNNDTHTFIHVLQCMYTCTVVSRASTHSWVSAHVPHFKGPLQQLLYKRMEFWSQVSVYVDQNRELCLSAHGRLPRTIHSCRYYYYSYMKNNLLWTT